MDARLRGWAVVVVSFIVMAIANAATAQTLTLEDAIRRAQGETAAARAVASSIDEANARIDRAQSGYWPRIDLAETVQRGNQPVYVFGSLLSQRRFSAANFAIPSLNNPDPVTNTRTAVTLDQPIYNAGLTRLGVEAATLERDMTAAALDGARLDLGFHAAQAFVRVLQLEVMVRVADAAVTATESDRQRARARRDVGIVTDADVLAVDVQLADMRQRHIAVSGDLAVARIQLAEAVGLPLTASITPVRPAAPPVRDDVEVLVREALTRHPQLAQATINLHLAENAKSTARAALWPTVGVQGGWEFNGATLGAQQSSWMVGAEVRVNLFRGFADTARISEADHARVRATAERERIERQTEVEVRAALAQLASARAREEAGRAALTQARESQRIIRDRYEGGLATVTDVLRAAAAVLDAESRATTAEMDVILQSVALDRALGRL